MVEPKQGRPRGFESRRRTAEFLRLLSDGLTVPEALRGSRLSGVRLGALFEDSQFRAVVCALIDQRQSAA